MLRALTVVGTGIEFGSHLTAQARSHIAAAEHVFFLVDDPITREFLLRERPDAESLQVYYDARRARRRSYDMMVERILAVVRAGRRVCVVLYGHPGVFACIAHEAIALARADGYEAVMFPAVSAEDCLFADLGVDPAEHGCVSFEATDFLVHRRRADPTASLVLWQIGAIGELRAPIEVNAAGVRVLTETLLEIYPPDHEVVVYEAAQYVVCSPAIERVALRDLPSAKIGHRSTLYVPPCASRRADIAMLARLAMIPA